MKTYDGTGSPRLQGAVKGFGLDVRLMSYETATTKVLRHLERPNGGPVSSVPLRRERDPRGSSRGWSYGGLWDCGRRKRLGRQRHHIVPKHEVSSRAGTARGGAHTIACALVLQDLRNSIREAPSLRNAQVVLLSYMHSYHGAVNLHQPRLLLEQQRWRAGVVWL